MPHKLYSVLTSCLHMEKHTMAHFEGGNQAINNIQSSHINVEQIPIKKDLFPLELFDKMCHTYWHHTYQKLDTVLKLNENIIMFL